jgi:hypothetical protein
MGNRFGSRAEDPPRLMFDIRLQPPGSTPGLTRRPAVESAQLVHECSISGYTWLETLDYERIFAVSETIPEGESCQRLVALASETGCPKLSIGAAPPVKPQRDRRDPSRYF